MEFTIRQKEIIKIVKKNEPISSERIAKELGLSRATLRSDLAILTMTGVLDARPKVGYFYSGQDVEPLLFDQLYQKCVKELMIPPLLIAHDTSISEAVTTLFMYDVGSLYIIDAQQDLVGVVSRKDLLRSTVNSTNVTQTPIAMIMTRVPNVITVSPNAALLQAGHLLLRHQVDSLPVIDPISPQKVIGKITKSILMKHFIEAGIEIKNRGF